MDGQDDAKFAVASLGEELSAMRLYKQRIAACQDQQLRSIFEHNLREEIEHATKILRWIKAST